MKLRLFGIDLPLNAGGGFDGDCGSFKVKITRESAASVQLQLRRSDARFTVDLNGIFTAATHPDDAERLLLTGVTTVAPATAKLAPAWPGLAAFEIALSTTTVVAGEPVDAYGIAFRHPVAALLGLIRQIPVRAAVDTMKWHDQGWSAPPLVSFQVPGARLPGDAVFLYEAPKFGRALEIFDGIWTDAPEPEPGPQVRQQLRLIAVSASEAGVAVTARPELDALLVHPDILTSQEARMKGNELFFQHALVNGEFRLTRRADLSGFEPAKWVGRHDTAGAAGFLALRMSDEHGNPLLVEAEGNDAIPLGVRTGTFTDSSIAGAGAKAREQTIPGLVIHRDGAAPLGGLRLRSVDPRPRKTPKDRLPWIGENGLVRALDRPPSEIHGVAKGTSLRREGVASAGAAMLHFDACLYPQTGEKLYTTLELGLDPAAGWKLVAQAEEVEYGSAKAAAGAVRARVAEATGSPIRVPLFDTSFAFANLASEKLVAGHILKFARERMSAWNQGLVQAFRPARLDDSRHESGFAFLAPGAQALVQVLTPPPGAAASARETGRLGVDVAPGVVDLVFGRSDEDLSAVQREIRARMTRAAEAEMGKYVAEFAKLWYLPQTGDVEKEIAKLRDALGEARPYLDVLVPAELRARLEARKADVLLLVDRLNDALFRGRVLLGVSAEVLEQLRVKIPSPVDFDAVVKLWRSQEPVVRAFLDALWGPPLEAAYRRAIQHFLVHKDEFPHLPRVVFDWEGAAGFVGAQILTALIPPVLQGVDAAFAEVAKMWGDPALEPLRRKYGPALTADVLARLLRDDARENAWLLVEPLLRDQVSALRKMAAVRLAPVLERLRAAGDTVAKKYADVTALLAGPLADIRHVAEALTKNFPAELLSAIRLEPPEYIFVTQRYPTHDGEVPKDPFLGSGGTIGQGDFERRLWNHNFRLCDFGSKHWDFFLGDGSAVVLKLTGKRGMGAILEELRKTYATPARPDPLGLLDGKAGGDPVAALKGFVERLDPRIRDESWRGLLIIRPTADLRGDEQLRNLCGFPHLEVEYVAVGGGRPDVAPPAGAAASPFPTTLDTYARIHQVRPAAGPDGEEGALADAAFTLVRFDATIANARLVDGEVVFRLDVLNLLGSEKKYPPILVRGTLPRAKPNPDGTAPAETPSFEFSAWIDKPLELDIDVAFLKQLVFRALRVSTSKGRTSLEIDADLTFRDELGEIELPVPGLALGGVGAVKLQNFRIVLPPVGAGTSVRMGLPRVVDFEFPSVSISIPKPRAITLWGGIELKPFGVGLMRKVADAATDFAALADRYQWLYGDPPWKDFKFPFLRCELDFGKLPAFGGTQLSALRFELLVGVALRRGQLPVLKLAIGGVDARDISVDLFGLLKLEIERFLLRQAVDKDKHELTLLLAKDVRLSILGWSPLPDAADFSILFAQDAHDNSAALAWYADGLPEGFFRLHWLLISRNWKFDAELNNYLLGSTSEHPAKLLDQLVVDAKADKDGKPEAGSKLQLPKATLDPTAGWLFGTHFSLGDVVEDGVLVFHDQHYYGISLRGPFVELLTGQPRLELAYIPGPTRRQDRFRTNLRLPMLDLIGLVRSGEFALEWSFNWDFLLDFGFPWKLGASYQWERAFSLPMGTYEAKFGFYLERRTQPLAQGAVQVRLAAGVGFYVGYYWGFGTPGKWVWANAGIGVFAILEGAVVMEFGTTGGLKGKIVSLEVRGVVGVYAYGEGGIEIWVISARFRVWVQAALMGHLLYLPGGSSTLSYAATLAAGYSASVRIRCGFFKITFRVSGKINIEVSGKLTLS